MPSKSSVLQGKIIKIMVINFNYSPIKQKLLVESL